MINVCNRRKALLLEAILAEKDEAIAQAQRSLEHLTKARPNLKPAQYEDLYWRLALAAYNSGEGTVQNLLKRHKATTYDAIASHLPAETQMFVPKVEATLQRREGMKLADLPPPKT